MTSNVSIIKKYYILTPSDYWVEFTPDFHMLEYISSNIEDYSSNEQAKRMSEIYNTSIRITVTEEIIYSCEKLGIK